MAHIEAKYSYGFFIVTKSPRNNVVISVENWGTVRIRANFIAISAEGVKGLPFYTVLATTTVKARSN